MEDKKKVKVHARSVGNYTVCGVHKFRVITVDPIIGEGRVSCKRCRKSLFLKYNREAEGVGVQLNRVRSLRDKFRG